MNYIKFAFLTIFSLALSESKLPGSHAGDVIASRPLFISRSAEKNKTFLPWYPKNGMQRKLMSFVTFFAWELVFVFCGVVCFFFFLAA